MREAHLKELAHLSSKKSQEKSLFRDRHGRLGAKLFALRSSIKYLGARSAFVASFAWFAEGKLRGLCC